MLARTLRRTGGVLLTTYLLLEAVRGLIDDVCA